MLILGLKSEYLAEGFKKLVRRIEDELEVKLFDNISFRFKDLCSSILIDAASDKLLYWRHLIGFLEFSRDVEGSHPNKLQLTERHFFY
jgi:hypothetical protein